MIHIIDDYYVDGGARDFTLVKKTNSIDKKGNIVYKPLGYYSCVATAVESVRKIKCRELTTEKNMELSAAINAFKGIAGELAKATEGLK